MVALAQSIRIETYTDKYHQDIVNLVQNFHKEAVSAYDDLFDAMALCDRIAGLKDSQAQNAFLLIVDDVCQGLLFGIEYKSMVNNRRVFQEAIWYVNEPFRKYGVKLLRIAEKELKSRGVSIMIMAVLENSKTEKIKSFYGRLGYKPLEVHYIRSL